MIIGMGIDIIDIRRIDKAIKRYGNKFKNTCFLNSEISRSENRNKTSESFAKRYAAKEACAKALGTGLARGVFWKDIELINNKYGKPKIILHNNAKKLLNEFNYKNPIIEVSLADEKDYAVAFVTISIWKKI